MPPRKLYLELRKLKVATLVVWIITTCAPIAVMFINGGLPVPDGASIPRQTHLALLDLTQSIIYYVIPGLTGGYLLIGLSILKHAQKAKVDDETKRAV